MVTIISSSRYRINRTRLKGTVERVLLEATSSSKHLNLVFVGKTKMKSISSTYKNEDVALPVLSFPIRDSSDPRKEFIGEVFICYPQAILLAAERNRRVDDVMTELVEHGVRNLLK